VMATTVMMLRNPDSIMVGADLMENEAITHQEGPQRDVGREGRNSIAPSWYPTLPTYVHLRRTQMNGAAHVLRAGHFGHALQQQISVHAVTQFSHETPPVGYRPAPIADEWEVGEWREPDGASRLDGAPRKDAHCAGDGRSQLPRSGFVQTGAPSPPA
jgi:hypothetical protein